MNWLCIQCQRAIPSQLEKIEIDDLGFHFFCPYCGRRHKLIPVGDIALFQFRQAEVH